MSDPLLSAGTLSNQSPMDQTKQSLVNNKK